MARPDIGGEGTSVRNHLIAITILSLSLAAPAAGQAEPACVTGDCHAILGKAKVVHQPVAEGDCAACHSATDRPHPGAGSMTLAGKGRALCLACHDDPAAGLANVHPPVADDCTACHSPHQSAHSRLLLQPGGKLCLMCHDGVLTGKKVHGPVFAGNCALCHLPHAGSSEALLTRPGNDLCLSCHPDIARVIQQAKSQHEPVANGRCWECHTPHASSEQPLLRAAYPREFYVSYAEERYALCFTCHDPNAFNYERTTEATAFRNRDGNLHYFHVNRQVKGRVCKSCHGVHGADQEKLLLSRVPHFGKWEIPLLWVPTESGAACFVGCHAPKAYDRVKKAVNR